MDVFELEADSSAFPLSSATKPMDIRRSSRASRCSLPLIDEDLEMSPPNQPPIQHHRRGTLSQSYEVEVGSILKHKAHKRTANDFERLKVLGTGAYGKVMLVRDKTNGKLYAQKQLKKASIVIEQKMIDQTMSERQILEAVRHPYIVKLHYAIQDSHKLYLILQYAQGGELFTHLAAERMLGEDTAAYYGAQVICALCHLHNNGIVYRDLKPENCLLDKEGNLLLTDFGLSKISSSSEPGTCNSMLGTPEYMAPEVLLGEPYDHTVDWWSLGALLYDFMTGNPPFTGANHHRVINKIVGMKYKPNLPFYLSADAKDLLRKLLKKEPNKRLGHKQFETFKKHRFFRKINWDQIINKSPELDPPIKPIVGDPSMAENFSSEFTSMVLSPPDNSLVPPGPSGGRLFEGFSYVGSLPREMN